MTRLSKKCRYLALLTAVVMILSMPVVSSCRKGPTSQKDVIIAAYPRDFRNIDPAHIPGSPDYQIAMNVFNGLVRYKADSTEVEGDLAEKWDISPDGKVYTFYLRKDVDFQKGYGHFTANDVKYSFERILNPATKSRYASMMSIVSKIDVVNDYTVRITLKEPSAGFLGAVLAFRPGFIVPKKAVEELGDKFALHPVGTGPFQFVSYTARQEMVLEANPKYFRGKPQIKKVIWKIVPDENVAALALASGEINYMIVRDTAVYKRLKETKGIAMTATPVTGWVELGFNLSRKPLDDIRVRQAIAYAIDRETFIKTVLEGLGTPAYSAIPAGMFGHTDGVEKYPYNPAKARELLKAAGYAKGLKLDYLIGDSPDTNMLAPTLQAWLKDIGINLEIVKLETGAYSQRQSKGEYYITSNLPTRFEPDQILTEFFESSGIKNGMNLYHYDKIDDLIKAQKQAVNPEQRKQLLYQIQRKIAEDLPMVPVFNMVYITAYKDTFKGHPANTGHWMTRFEFLKVDKGK